MPSVLFLCPHCEKHAEVKVTSVTRSRTCPHCGENVMLQTGAKDTKRRALLVGAPEIAEGTVDKPLAPAYEPQVIEGEVFERLKMDPEVREFRNKLIFGVAVVAGLIILAVVGDTWLKSPPDPAPVVKTAAVPLPVSELIWEDSRPPADAAKRSELAQAATRKFLSATSVGEYLALVSRADRWEAAIKRYLLLKPLKPVPVMSLSLHDSEGQATKVDVVRATLLGGGDVELNIVWQNEEARVDWPSFVGWSEMEWSSVMTQVPHEPFQLRVIAELAENFTNGFSDAGSLLCLKISDPMTPTSPPLFAYAKRSSDEAKRLSALLRKKGVTAKVALALHYPEHSKSRDQLWIDKVVSLSWYDTTNVENSHAASTAH